MVMVGHTVIFFLNYQWAILHYFFLIVFGIWCVFILQHLSIWKNHSSSAQESHLATTLESIVWKQTHHVVNYTQKPLTLDWLLFISITSFRLLSKSLSKTIMVQLYFRWSKLSVSIITTALARVSSVMKRWGWTRWLLTSTLSL